MIPRFLRRPRSRRYQPGTDRPRDLDPETLDLVAPGYEDVRRMLPDGTRILAALDANATEIRGLVQSAAHATEPGDPLGIVVVNDRAAALEDVDLGCSADALRSIAIASGLEIVEAYGIGYIPGALARGARDLAELRANGGVFASPEDCVLLAFHCRASIDARA